MIVTAASPDLARLPDAVFERRRRRQYSTVYRTIASVIRTNKNAPSNDGAFVEEGAGPISI